uniref:Uncharacterized protein n=1 Tax=Helianthus annuus TaxID=4232 RepID=A0A251SMR9_HELAN
MGFFPNYGFCFVGKRLEILTTSTTMKISPTAIDLEVNSVFLPSFITIFNVNTLSTMHNQPFKTHFQLFTVWRIFIETTRRLTDLRERHRSNNGSGISVYVSSIEDFLHCIGMGNGICACLLICCGWPSLLFPAKQMVDASGRV